ncbi:hypothetical protein KNO81_19940 [Paraburkholderia sediminicola]|nr:hypothetical protein [Paraburkholderia sediminicola]
MARAAFVALYHEECEALRLGWFDHLLIVISRRDEFSVKDAQRTGRIVDSYT